MRRIIAIFMICHTFAWSYCALAQTSDQEPGNKEFFQKFLASDLHKGLVAGALAGIPPSVFRKCPSLQSSPSRILIVEPVSFAEDKVPNGGMWRQQFPVKGCGNDTILNLFFIAKKDEKIDVVVGLPGTTSSNLTLQRDAIKFAFLGASLKAKECKQFTVTNTRFESFGLKEPETADPGKGTKFRPWSETWTVAACGHTLDVPLNFSPSEKGTQIIQNGKDVLER